MPEHPDFNLDDAISADLDGELAPYAAELSLDLPTLRAQMTARPDYPDRLAAMETARQSLHATVEPLDDVTRARLLRGVSTQANQPSGRATSTVPLGRARMVRILAAAAVVVLVVGGGVALLGRDGSSSNQQSKASTNRVAEVRSGQLGNLGPLDPKKLDALIGGGSDAATKSGDSARQTTTSVPPGEFSAASGGPRQTSASSQAKAAADLSATLAQVDACRAEYIKLGTVRFSGTGDYQGRPAVVLGVESGGRTIVFAVAATDCSEVLVSVSR